MNRTAAAILGALIGGTALILPVQAAIGGAGTGTPAEIIGGALMGALAGAGLHALLAKRRRA